MENEESSYDGDITIFSPQGRLYQVEYARETVKKGTTTIGIKFKNGVVLLSMINNNSKIIENKSLEKINPVSENMACTFCGLSADARQIVNYAIDEMQINKLGYGDDLSVKSLVENICAYINIFSRYQAVRPFGVVMIFGGIDKTGAHLYATDPSGAFVEYKAICEGKKSEIAEKYIEKNYIENLNFEKALILALESIRKTTSKKITSEKLEIGILEKDKSFKKLTKTEIDKYLKKVK